VTEPSHAVFLSYASQDAEAAQRICEALRAGGIEVWFDQSALRGGDVWDQTIRKQIKSCVLFIPVISQHTHERDEGYFRLEWKLAVDRSHLMTTDKAFLLPVVIDDTREDDENVPDRFKDIHWTRLRGGETPPAFVERVRRLVSPGPSHGPMTNRLLPDPVDGATKSNKPRRSFWRSKSALPVIAAVVLSGGAAYFAIDKFSISNHRLSPATLAPSPASLASAAFAPPPHSIAVLPFVNLSGDASQDYFSDGLTEELLNSLAEINELRVAARTSSFSFREHPDIATVAQKLNVATVLEGSVRRSSHTVRVTAQLINAVTGFHMWSKTYDRDLGDVLKLQTDIATAVATALKVTLLGDVGAKIELGGTRNPAAFDAYLRASKAYSTYQSEKDAQAAIATYTEAIRLDPDYALAYADRSLALGNFATNWASGPAVSAYQQRARADARNAIALAPDLAAGHLALAFFLETSLEFTAAIKEYERALALGSGNARLLRLYGTFAALMGQKEAGLSAARRAVALDPLNSNSHVSLGLTLIALRRYDEAVVAFRDAKSLAPNDIYVNGNLGVAYYLSGNFQDARSSCEAESDDESKYFCLAMTFDKLGRRADAETVLAKMRSKWGNSDASFYARIYAQWRDTTRALDWLEIAMRQRDPSLIAVRTSPLLDPLRKEPRFQAIERELKFPN